MGVRCHGSLHLFVQDVLVPVQLSFAATYELLDGSSAANPADSTDSVSVLHTVST